MSAGRSRGPTGAGGEGDGGSRAWESSAACRYQDAELWFSRRSSPRAVAICAACPVLAQCRAAVLIREKGLPECHRDGVIAGLTGPQRYALERQADGSWPGPAADPGASRAPVGAPRGQPARCGTRAAYQRHLRLREPVDEACRLANARSVGRYRRTGTTRARNEAARDPAAANTEVPLPPDSVRCPSEGSPAPVSAAPRGATQARPGTADGSASVLVGAGTGARDRLWGTAGTTTLTPRK
ncbi:WhiB family transcriptional regulator [Streptomyces sp. NBC_01334]|uniref:WhiB family transcriptional regulator n=1 Tax=Streptomyces sp. NBC_01334 TaxID=2903827 RepID=UPI002E105E61|nr:WhiB family transcriptional regulator [Streptomyces sp. NBC_01334]